MSNITKNYINTIAYKNIVRNFNIIIGISFIILISALYIISIFSINIPNSNLETLENIFNKNFIFYTRIFFSFLIPLTFFIFIFLFLLNPISIRSILISFVFISIISVYLYGLNYSVVLSPFDDFYCFIKLILHILSANLLIIFILSMSYIRYDFKKLYYLPDFYTMIAEIIIWFFLIFFIIFLIILSLFAFLYFNGYIEIKKIIRFLIRDNMKNLKICLSIFIVLNISIIYFSYVIYSKMINTKLSINVSRVLALFISIISIFIIVYSFQKNNYSNILLLGCFIFSVFFLLNTFLFRIDKEHNRVCFFIYIISNISGFIFSIFCLKNYIDKISYTFFIIFNVIMIINFSYNVVFTIMKKLNRFLYLYNYLYIIFLIILLFY